LLGLDDNPPDLTIHLSPQATSKVNRLLEEHGVPASKPLVVLVPGTIWETKHWTLKDSLVLRGNFFRMDLPSLWRAPRAINSDADKSPPAAPGTCDLSGKTTPADLAGADSTG
jgi:hypothetical protein